jgi:hypothetical protein
MGKHRSQDRRCLMMPRFVESSWMWTRGWACTTIVRNALCAWANTNGRMGAPVGRVIRPWRSGRARGWNYGGRYGLRWACTYGKVAPVDGARVSIVIMERLGTRCGKSAESTPVEWNGMSFDRQHASGHTVCGTVVCTLQRICLGQ